jgi:Domain of unknown function (DUF4129)
MASQFEKTNFAWDFRLWQQRTGEWFERIQANWQPSIPDTPNSSVRPPEVLPQVWTTLFWLLVVALVTVILWNLYPIVDRYFATQRPQRPTPEPATPDRSQTEWIQQARQAQSQGDYTQACRALYLAMIKKLQDQSLLSTDPSLTNGEYRHLLKTRSRPQPYRTLINAHDESLYTDRKLSAERYAECDRAYREIDQEVS